MPSENTVQKVIHTIEQGSMQSIIKAAMIGTLILALFLIYFCIHFRGFADEHAMDQAQIARSLAAGEGFTTKYIRPMAIWKLSTAEKPIPKGNFPEFYNAPLNSFVNSIPLALIKSKWNMDYKDAVYVGDQIIAFCSTLFFLAAVGIGFFIARALFDTQLALLGSACVLLTDLMWEFSLSGLPQMLMLFLFMTACWFSLCALRAAMGERRTMVFPHVVLASFFLGLLTLAHGIGFWFFLGFLVFTLIYFRPLGMAAILATVVYLVTVSPWLIYNYHVCGNPFGISVYIGLKEVGHEDALMRSLNPYIAGSTAAFSTKIGKGILSQSSQLFSFLGLNIVAIMFFISLLHPFRRPETAQFRWCILLMWFFAALGMAAFGVEDVVSSNQLHVLFVPIAVYYGMAFLLVLWFRLEIVAPLYRIIFIVLLLALCSVPMVMRIMGGNRLKVNWPPYFPPYIAILREWTKPNEIIGSDMPWAVAWYAQRKSLLLPESVKSFNEINDYNLLGGPIIGLYFTPISGNQRFVQEIMKGPFKEWAPFITRNINLNGLPYQAVRPLLDGEIILFADKDRWSNQGPK